VEQQFEWYVHNANWDIAERYLSAVEATCRLLGQHPQLGPMGGFNHSRLRNWRFFVVYRPFQKHVVFFEIIEDDVLMRRVMHGHQDLPKRLLSKLKL
jgi:plasmid stabilization system protein ParE